MNPGHGSAEGAAVGPAVGALSCRLFRSSRASRSGDTRAIVITCGTSVVVAEASSSGAISFLARCSTAGVVTSCDSVGRAMCGSERHLLEGVANGEGEVTARGVSSLAPLAAVCVTSFALDSRRDCDAATMPHAAQMKARNHTHILSTDCCLELGWAGLCARTQRQKGNDAPKPRELTHAKRRGRVHD